MARQTRRKSRTKKSLPQRKADESSYFRKDSGFKTREEMKSWKVAVLLTGIFVLALFLRVYFNVSEATEDGFKMTGGSDPYYHKRAVDWVTNEHEHLIDDPMLNYPIGIPNPRPPVFDWTMALTGIAISPAFGGDVEESTWWAVEFIPALFGALIVIPVYLIGRESFDKRTGLMAAFLISIMAGHVGHTTFGLADHDSFFLFWVAVSLYYFQRAVNTLRDGDFVRNWTDVKDIRTGFGKMVRANRVSLGYALFSGMSMSVIALAWKGFPYIMTIVIAYFIVQLFVNKIKNVDSLNLSFIALTALALPMLLSAPYYALLGFDSWWTPPLYMLIAATVTSFIFIPTRRIPWLLVFSTIAAIAIIGYIFLLYVIPEFGDTVFSGAQYFVRTKLFDTIAEAQPPTLSRIAFSYGLVTFFLAYFIGIPYIIYKALKSERRDLMFIAVWAALAAYMSYSAIRFIFNGTPIMALLSAWVIIEILDWVDFRKMIKDIKTHAARGESIADKFLALKRGTSPRHVMGAVLVLFLVVFPNFGDALDAGIPYERKKEWDDKIYDFYDSNPITDNAVISMVPDDENFDRDSSSTWYLGSFGPSFPNGYWLSYFDWLKEQDNTTEPNKRPAFLSWWDYGFWAIQLGEHPTVADNFQTGYQFAGNFIAAPGEDTAIALLIQRLLDANIRDHGGKFGPEEDAILLTHMNEAVKDELFHIFKNPLDYETHNITAENGRIRAMRDVLTGNLTLDELADLYHDLQVSTGDSIRYFAIDSRLFPFSATNNIFYAPITLADLDVTRYLETLYVPGDANGNPTGERLTAEEVEARAEVDPDFRIVDTALEYKSEFYKTMLYKNFIGWDGQDVNMSLDDGIPSVTGVLQQQNIMPGWMMQHFREVYRTFYWNPYPPEEVGDHQDAWEPMSYREAIARGGGEGNISSGMQSGVVCLKYYDGAIVSGVVKTESGTPLNGVRVTALDDQLIPHDTVITGADGRYELIVPFGSVALLASKGDMISTEEYLIQSGHHVLNSTTINITDQQAMRLENWKITQDIEVPSASIHGKVYWDENDDKSYDESNDRIITDPIIVLRDIETNDYFNLTGDTDEWYGSFDPETGDYEYDGIPTGEYELTYVQGSHKKAIRYFTDDKALYPASETPLESPIIEQDIAIPPASISGTITYANGTRPDRVVTIVDTDDGSERTAFASNGKFLISYLLNGTYEIRVDGDDIYQSATDSILALEGEVMDANITLYPAVTVTGSTYYDAELRKNTTIYFNSTIPGLSTSVESDYEGMFSVKVASATYDITAAEYVGRSYHADYRRTSFSQDVNMVFDMKDTHEVEGIVYFDKNGNNTYDDVAANREEVADSYVILRGEDFVLSRKANGLGRFEFNVPEGRYSIEAVDNETRRTAFQDVTVTEDAEVFIQLGSAHTISGRVTTSGWTGQYATNLIPGVSLVFSSGSENYFTTTDETGSYEIFLPAGSYTADVSNFGYFDLSKSFEVEENTTVDFILDPEHVLMDGLVTYKGTPMSGVIVRYDSDFTTTTDANGYYSIPLPPKNYHITYTKMEGDYRYFKARDMTLNIGAREVTYNPILQKQLKVEGSVLYRGSEKTGDILFDSSDFSVSHQIENGSFITYMIPGHYKVQVNMEGNTYLRLMDIQEPVTLNMDTDQFLYIRGYLYNDLDMNDKYSGSDDGVKGKISYAAEGSFINDTTSSSGYYSLRIYPQEYIVTITAEGYEDHVEELNIVLENQMNFKMIPFPIELSGTVWHDRNGNGEMEPIESLPYVPITIKVRNEDVTFETVSDGKGNYSYILNPGRYQFTAEYSYFGKNFSTTSTTRDVTLEEGADKVVHDIELWMKYEVRGTVYDALKGTVVKDAIVEFLDEHGNTIDDTETDEDGNYLVIVAEEDYTVRVYTEDEDRPLVYLDRLNVDSPQDHDINLVNGVRLHGVLYSGDVENGIDIGRIDFIQNTGIVLNTYTGDDGDYEIYVTPGFYTLEGSDMDFEEVPDVEYVLDTEIEVTGGQNYQDHNIDLEKKLLYGFEWSVDSDYKESYIEYYAAGYVGPEFVFTITNTGNESESVGLTYSFDNITYWENTNFEPDTIDIPAGETGEVIFRLRAIDDTPPGREAVITINASVTDEEEISKEMEIRVKAVEGKKADALLNNVEIYPEEDIYEDEEFIILAELTNTVEFSKDISVTTFFDRQTKSGQWEVIGKNDSTLSYGSQTIVSQTTSRGEGDHTYRVRVVPDNAKEDKDSTNNEETMVIEVNEEPEKELTGWKGILDLGTNNSRISWLLLIVIMSVLFGTSFYLVGSKKRRRSRRYRRRHSR